MLLAFATGLVGRDDARGRGVERGAEGVCRPPRGQRSGQPRPYLFRAVVNEASTWSTRAAQRVERERLPAGSAPTWELPSFRPDVRAAVERLSVQQRAVILLTYWADLDPCAIADHLGISEGSCWA